MTKRRLWDSASKRKMRERSRRKSRAGNTLRPENLEPRQLLAVGPQLIAVNPNSGEVLRNGDVRHEAPQQLTLIFNEGQEIETTSLDTGIRISRSNLDGIFDDGDDIIVTPGYMDVDPNTPNQVIIRFAETLPDDRYRIELFGATSRPLTNVNGDAFNSASNFEMRFDLDLGAQVVAVVPQPVTRNASGALQQATNQIEVYFSDDDLNPTSASNPAFYRLYYTHDSVSNLDDDLYLPTAVSYDNVADKATLTFSTSLTNLGNGAGTFRLRIGTAETRSAAPMEINLDLSQEPGDSFATARNLQAIGTQNVIVSAAIEPQVYLLDYPGSNEDPGHRDDTYQTHVNSNPDTQMGITRFGYSFRDVYGVTPKGVPLHNVITENQKELARQIFALYESEAGVQFFEVEEGGEQALIEAGIRFVTVVTGDMRAIDPEIPTGPGGVIGVSGSAIDPVYGALPTVIMDNAEIWDDTFGATDIPGAQAWFDTAMHEIGHYLGLGHTYELPPPTIMGDDRGQTLGNPIEPLFPGDNDIVHLQHLYRPESKDIDLYRFTLNSQGALTLETFAERLENSSQLDTVMRLYRQNSTGGFELLSQNDDYFSNDSYIELELSPGTYYVGVSASGNDTYDPRIADSGMGGTTQGAYELRLNFRPDVNTSIVDSTGTALDGDADGVPGGVFNFWFQAQTTADTIFVDKSAPAGGTGTLASPFNSLPDAMEAAAARTNISDATVAPDGVTIVRVVGNGGADGDVSTLSDNLAYEIGFDLSQASNRPLSDGSTLEVPAGVTVMVDAGAVFKLRSARIGVGSSALGGDRHAGALQVLGVPGNDVHFTSYNDQTIGFDTNPLPTRPTGGDWGGLEFRNDRDRADGLFVWEQEGIFLNYVNHADIRYGGGFVVVDSIPTRIAAVHMTDARPTVSYSNITRSADAAISANPNSFEETNFHTAQYQTVPFTSDVVRIGPDIRGNHLSDNSINGLFVRIQTPAGQRLQSLTVSGRWDDTDIVHVVPEVLKIQGTPGGPVLPFDADPDDLQFAARTDARLAIDPGVVVKLDGARVEVSFGAQLLAEGIDGKPIVFTSLADDRYGAGGTYDTNDNEDDGLPDPGDWAGIYVGHTSSASLDHAVLAYGGGTTKLEGTFASFNVLEIHQADVRVAHSTFEDNAGGTGGQAPAERFGLGSHASGTIFVRGAQPVIVDNVMRGTQGTGFFNNPPAININVSALNSEYVIDRGRSTGLVDRFTAFDNNQGPLIRMNQLTENDVNGMVVRAGTLTTAGVWDDTDIVHVVNDTINIPDAHTYGGLRLQSSPTESLVVKLNSNNAGFTTYGVPIDNSDRIGGALQIIGQPGRPVVLTSLADDSVGAGFDPDGVLQTDTNNDRVASGPAPGDWRSIELAEYTHDRNVESIIESELPRSAATNESPLSAQFIGALAPSERDGDENLRLGFEVQGFINRPADIDVYSFTATAGTQVWLDIDSTTHALDTIVELVTSSGQVLARSNNSFTEQQNGQLSLVAAGVKAFPMAIDPTTPRDDFSTNPRDAGMRVILPGPADTITTYHVRVRSAGTSISNVNGGLTSGMYQLQVRLQEQDEVPGTTIRGADIRFATNGVESYGNPLHSPLLGEVAEVEIGGTPQIVGNVLEFDRNALSISGFLEDAFDIDVFQFDVIVPGTQDSTGEPGDNYASLVFDLDYADGLARPDVTLTLYQQTAAGPVLVAASFGSNVGDDQSPPLSGSGLQDLDAGSLGSTDPLLGPIMLPEGTYVIAVSTNALVPTAFDVSEAAANPLVRIEPLDSISRVGEDHVGGGSTVYANPSTPTLLATGDEINPNDPHDIVFNSLVPWHLGDVSLYATIDTGPDMQRLLSVNPFTGTTVNTIGDFEFDVADLAFRENSELYAFTLGIDDPLGPTDDNSGALVQLDHHTGVATLIDDDGIETYEIDDMGDEPEVIRSNDDNGWGIQFEAMTFIGRPADDTNPDDDWIMAIGYRGDADMMPNGVTSVENLVYWIDPITGIAQPLLEEPTVDEFTADGTNVQTFLGEINTAFSAGGGDTALLVTEATELVGGVTTRLIPDGLTFGIGGVTFEMDAGPEAVVDFDLTAGEFIADGEFFLLNGTRFEFDGGPVLEVVGAGADFTDGDTITVVNDDTPSQTMTFEFDSGGGVLPGSRRIPFDTGFTLAQMNQGIVSAINAAAFGVTAELSNGHIVLTGDSGLVLSGAFAGALNRVGDYGVTSGNAVVVEENDTPGAVRNAIADAVNATGTLTAGVDGERLNFPDATTADFAGTQFIDALAGAAGGVAGANVEIDFLADDTGAEIATKIAAAVDNAVGAGTTNVGGRTVRLTGATVDAADAPFMAGGSAPGGRITGVTQLADGRVFAVSDEGGLYQINGDNESGVTGAYVDSAIELLGIRFTGLDAGPANVEDEAYAGMLFGIDRAGDLWAFDTAGFLQPVFMGGETSISTGLAGVEGIAFSTLDRNLWYETIPGDDTLEREEDLGHGVDVPFTGSREQAVGDGSLHFGLGEGMTYDFPGGARGTIISNSFSLEGYSPSDQPYLYFNYFLTGQDTEAGDDPEIFDSFRVYVSDDSVEGERGVWHLVATNNDVIVDTTDDFIPNDEYDDPNPLDSIDFPVQTLYDGAGWRQARIPLEQFAGRSGVRIRFDYSTAGSMNVGDVDGTAAGPLTGEELRAADGAVLRDGDVFSIDDILFEFDLGYTLILPTGDKVIDGETITVDGTTFEFDSDGNTSGGIPIPFLSNQTASLVAANVQRALMDNGVGGAELPINGNRLQLLEVLDLIQGQAIGATGLSIGLEGEPGAAFGTGVPINSAMSSVEVAQAMVQPIADELANGSTVAIKTFQDYVRVIGNSITDFVHPVTNEFTSGQGPLGRALVNPDPLNPIYLNGDQYGNYVNVFPDEAPPPALQQNLNEGVYIDDVIIGFAERGELVLNATVSDTLFIENPAREDTDIEVGGYQLEIRRATKYGEPTGLDEPPLALTRSFDTNARLDAAATIFAPSGADISESQTFIISDGVDVVTFEFDEIFFDDAGAPVLGDGVANGNVPVLFLPSMKDHEVASSLITAINGRAAQATLDVSAAFGDGTFIGLAATTSNQVNLFGDSVVLTTNPVFSPESNDQIDEAIGTGIVEDSIGTYWFGGYIGDNIELLEQPGGMTSDVDLYAVTLAAGQRLVVDIQTPQRGTTSLKTLESFVRVFDEAGVAVTFFDRLLGADANLESNDNDVFNRLPELWNPLEPDNIDTLNDYVLGSGYADPYLRFIAPADGTYYIGVSGAGNSAYDPNDASTAEPGGSAGAYFMRLDVGGGTIAPDSEALPSISINTLPAMGSGTIPYITYDYEGDDNRFRDQGQLIIQSNRIADSEEYAIRLEVAPRTADGLPKPGSTRVLRELNEGGLATSAVVMNNLLVGNLQGGVHISGYPDDDPTLPANPLAPIPFARVVNNTIYGVSDNDVGILVENNASPTLLNNILANLGQPIDLDFTSRSTIIGGSLYHRNDNGPTRAGDFAVTLANSATLFVDVANRNFIPVDGSAAIDSSIDSLDERAIQTTIKDPMGLARSPILAPEFDIDGQVRVDDPSVPSPPGLGQNVFKDRGAIDRVDFEGPIAVLLEPADNDAVGVDRNPAESIVDVALNLNLFQIQLVDLAEFGEGIGIDNNTVTSSSVTVTRDGQLLEQGVGYSYVYDSTNHVIRLRPVAGIWGGGTYVVSLDSDISDLAGNLLRPNQTNGDVTFTIIIDDSVALDYGDAPDPSYPTLLASDGASHIISPGLFLGNGVTADPDGKPSATGTADDGDDGVTFDSALVIGSSVPITVTASAAGQLDAWVDFNGDGDWLDVGERVFTSRALLAGDNVLNINIPATAADGDTFARFRFSSAGGLSPTGSADDGEVEDYRVNITQNPWHNFTDATDVINNDGTTLIDILRIITELDTHAFSDPASGRLPVPPPISSPPLLDVNNDGFVSPVDVILAIGVVDELIAQSQAVANIQPVSLPQAPLGEMIAADLSGIGSDDATVLVSPPPFSVANYVRNLPRDTSARDATFADGNADNQGVVRLSTASYTEEDGQAESSIQRRVARRATYRRDVSTELAVQTVRSTNEEETVDDLFAQW